MRIYAFAALPAVTSAYVIGGANLGRHPTMLRVSSGGRGCYPGRGGDPEEEFRRWQQKFDAGMPSSSSTRADEAFDSLMDDINRAAASPRDVQKQKDWVRRAFGMAAEFNRDVANSEDQAKKNEEILQKQQKWVDKIIDFATELNQDFSPPAPPAASVTRSSGSNLSGATRKSSQGEQGVATGGDFTMTPSYTINDDDDAFQVAMELPGVRLSEINIDADTELQILTISGERSTIGSDEKLKFSKTFGLDPSVRVDEISASLSAGILLVNAPKEVKQAKGKTLKIPVTSED